MCFLFNNYYPSPWIFFSLPFTCLCCVGQSTALFLWETERAQNWSYFMLGLPRSQFSNLHVNFHTSVSYGECYGNFSGVLGRQFIHDPLFPPPTRLQTLPLQRISGFIINEDFKMQVHPEFSHLSASVAIQVQRNTSSLFFLLSNPNKLAKLSYYKITSCWRSTHYNFTFFLLKVMLMKVYQSADLVITC